MFSAWHSPGHEPLKSLLQGLCFFCISRNQGKKNTATDLAVSQFLGSTIDIISAQVPGQHMWPGPYFKFSKTVEVGWLHQDLQFCQREVATDKIQEKKNYREHSNIKSARVSALNGSVPRKMAEARMGHCISPTATNSFEHRTMHRIRFRTCCFVPASYFYIETND